MNLVKTTLFEGCSQETIDKIIADVGGHISKYQKNQVIYYMGDEVDEMGFVLHGSVHAESMDLTGKIAVHGISRRGEIFAEACATVGQVPMTVSIVAMEETEVFFINPHKLTTCSIPGSDVVVRNMLHLMAQQALNLTMRIVHTTPRKIRDRLNIYFTSKVNANGGNHEFTVPFDRQRLADYLGVDRTALSKELGKMREEGLIDFKGNKFKILMVNCKIKLNN